MKWFSFPSNKQRNTSSKKGNLVCMHGRENASEVERLLKGSSTEDICRTSTVPRAMYFQEFSRSIITGNRSIDHCSDCTIRHGIAGLYGHEP
jgi:hypothetical protein